MKKYYFLCLLIAIPLLGISQTYGNEWINYAQKYYKIKVAKDGIYRIDSLTLAKAGIALNTINPKNFQVFFRGKQQYIYVQGEASGIFTKNDYIEFYGQHNDGALDSALYPGKTGSPNPYYSLFNDTSTYYLTWNTSLSNYRMNLKSDTSFSSHKAASYFIAKTVNYGNSEYYGGRRYVVGGLTASDPRYTGAEGWFNSEIDLGQTTTYNLNVANVSTAGPAAVFKTLFAGESDAGFTPDHHIQIKSSWGGASPITDTILCDTFPVITTQYNVPPALLAGSVSMSFYSSSAGLSPSIGSTGNITAVSYVTAQYPHTSNMGGAYRYTLYVPDTAGPSEAYLDLSNFNYNPGDTVRFYDLTNHNRIKVIQGSGLCKALVPNGGGLKQCYMTSDDSVYKAPALIPVGNGGTFTDYTPVSRGGSTFVIITHPSLMAQASLYAGYRISTGYNVVLSNIEELYDQYGYGVEKDPMAIRDFCNYALHKWRSPPQFLLLLGKGIHAPIYRPDSAKSAYSACLLPSMGYPSSDMLLTAGLLGNGLKPGIATGRIAAADGAEVTNYLSKLETYESTPHALWMKNVVHFAGGGSAGEQATILGYLSNYTSIIESPLFGGDVYLFKKTSSDPIQITLADSVTQLINNGVAIMTFFGHASGNNFDESLDAPSDYNNVGKYPLIIADACFSGDIFQPVGFAVSSTSEQFVLDPKGSIGFIATDDIGEEGHLFTYTRHMYNDISNVMYRKPLGLCMQNTVSAVQSPWDIVMTMTCLEMTLHGDPAVAVNAKDSLPDYAVTDSSIYFTPANVTTQLNTFKVSVVVSNLGEALNQPVQMLLTRFFPNGTTANYDTVFNHIYYQDTITFTLPVDKINGPGLNKFSVNVDPSNLLRELTKTNNQLPFPTQLLITSGDIIPVYPYEYAIIPNDTVTLKASTGDPNAPLRKYLFQVDTTGLFNSPWLKSQVVSATGGVVCAAPGFWVNTPYVAPFSGGGGGNLGNGGGNGHRPFIPPHGKGDRAMGAPLTFKDSTVYYWRVMRDTSDTKDFPWEESSFQYLIGKTGWGQSHFYQFSNNSYTYLVQNIPGRRWDFPGTGKTLECFAYGIPLANFWAYTTQAYATGYKLDLTVEAYGGCQTQPGIYVAIIDQTSVTPWSTGTYSYGNINYKGSSASCIWPDNKFIYWNNSASQMSGLNSMLNSVPNGDYILAYSWVEGGFQEWADSAALRTTFKNLGASPGFGNKANYPDTVPWIFFAQKGNKASAVELKGMHTTDTAHLITTLPYKEDFGSMLTPLIGPAQKWDSLAWRQHPYVTKNKDSVRINVIGVDANGNPKTLIQGITPAVASMYLTSINPKIYPYLQLSSFTKDTLSRTPSQMDKWQVFFTPVPEVAVNPSVYSFFHKDSLNVGDTINYRTVIQNISPYPIDSLFYNTWVVDAGNAIHNFPGKYTKKLKPGDTTIISAKVPTLGYPNNNSVWMEVNPLSLAQTRPEEYHFNNYAKENFYVIGDKTNPLMDVTFDGIHILNNDIVSPHPNILIEVMDENKYLALNDTSDFAVYIRNTNNQVSQRVYFGSIMTFTPAILPNNRCKILYTPVLQDGTYELSVQSKDRSGNLSGTNNYKIDFQVINKSMITNVLNYPNPFSTSTRFVFTLTGDQVPTYFKIQIMTITGKVVKEITENELGPLHIGRNITEYGWDGTDQFGDRLANGVYLYRVITSLDGQAIDHFSTDADQYFNNGWGKMYIIH